MTITGKNAAVTALLIVFAACSTTGKAPTQVDSGDQSKSVVLGKGAAEKGVFPRITLKQDESTLGETVRRIGQESGSGLVVSYGLGRKTVAPVKFTKANYESVVTKLASLTGATMQNCSTYYFLMKPGEEQLREISLLGKLSPRHDALSVGLSIGAGTRLYTALALINQATTANVVADNAIAEVHCGEMTLSEVPLQYNLEALLKSAHVVAYEVESTDEFVFIRYNLNDSPKSTLLNESTLDERQRAHLERKISLYLPEPTATDRNRALISGSQTLASMLEPLSKQLGVKVVAEESMRDFPVNPLILKDVRVSTAMDLLIRQWPVGEFGYQFTHDRIVIRRMTPADRPAL